MYSRTWRSYFCTEVGIYFRSGWDFGELKVGFFFFSQCGYFVVVGGIKFWIWSSRLLAHKTFVIVATLKLFAKNFILTMTMIMMTLRKLSRKFDLTCLGQNDGKLLGLRSEVWRWKIFLVSKFFVVGKTCFVHNAHSALNCYYIIK